jgi:hypothetical protein
MTFKLKRRAAIGMSGPIGLSLLAPRFALPAVSAAETLVKPSSVTFQPEIEPLVQLLENTPRDEVFTAVSQRLHLGTSYRELLAALFLAAIRNVQPRPSVGFKFHSVLVVNSTHLASLAASDATRWLPIFWGIDYFKRTQADDEREGDWTMAAVDESRLPEPANALDELNAAMDAWDIPRADAAAAVAARVIPVDRLFDLFARYGARDFRNIGHKAIYVAGAFRLLEVIGWQHAEPVLRSLTYALLNHTGEPNPRDASLSADAAGRANHLRCRQWPASWIAGKPDANVTTSLITSNRELSPDAAGQTVTDMIGSGVAPVSIYDALFASAAELVMRQPAIVPLHAMTTTNAIHYLFKRTSDDSLRRWLLLQNASFIAHFREAAQARDALAPRFITELQTDATTPTLEETLAVVGSGGSPSQVLAYLNQNENIWTLMTGARELIFRKGNDSHDYKYSSALFEDCSAISPEWRPRVLAAASPLLTGSQSKDTDLPARVAAAFN